MIPADLDPTVLYTGAGVAVVLLGALLTFLSIWQRQRRNETSQILSNVEGLVKALTDGKGKPSIPPPAADKEAIRKHERHLTDISSTLALQGEMQQRQLKTIIKLDRVQQEHRELHQQQLRAITRLDKGQQEIMEHLTNGPCSAAYRLREAEQQVQEDREQEEQDPEARISSHHQEPL